MTVNIKEKAKNNRTIVLTEEEIKKYKLKTIKLEGKTELNNVLNKNINQNLFEAEEKLPASFVDLLFVDPPYNIDRKFNEVKFKALDEKKYEEWMDSWLKGLVRLLKPTASVYVCCDWKSSSPVFNILSKYSIIQNRITWEREKGRGAKANWKNCTEDIWFATVSKNYTFNIDDVKLKRKVIAPYKSEEGMPKDWQNEEEGNFRITAPSNIWTDISIPFWSMPENTDHPTQKPEKLLAKIILASSNKGDVVLDPFAGSGTTQVTAKKLGRRYVGIELDEYYCCLAEKRLEMADEDTSIQGYEDGVFWERNTLTERKNKKITDKKKNIK